MSRRALGTIGASLTLSGLLRAAAANGATTSQIKSCVFVFFYGGPSHLDTWDPKPGAPSTVRGEFQPISTTVPGVQICEHLPQMARVMHHCAVVRSMHHTNRLHDSASIETFTGRQASQGDREEFAPIPQFYPAHGAVVSQLRPSQAFPVTHATLPGLIHNVVTTPCQGGGFLGRQFDPFEIQADVNRLSYQVDLLRRLDELSFDRVRRRNMLRDQLAPVSRTGTDSGLDWYSQRALDLLSSSVLESALDLSAEPQAVRERYGWTMNAAEPGDAQSIHAPTRAVQGQNLLLARRLVEAGVPFVNVNDFLQQGQNWDSHSDNFKQHRRYLLPQADRADHGLHAERSGLRQPGSGSSVERDPQRHLRRLEDDELRLRPCRSDHPEEHVGPAVVQLSVRWHRSVVAGDECSGRRRDGVAGSELQRHRQRHRSHGRPVQPSDERRDVLVRVQQRRQPHEADGDRWRSV
jgi:hypothetical protein